MWQIKKWKIYIKVKNTEREKKIIIVYMLYLYHLGFLLTEILHREFKVGLTKKVSYTLDMMRWKR